jgi:spermidine/putrescine transport system substrate-binding protein
MAHPRERWTAEEISRRDFLRRSAGAALGLSGAALLAACGTSGTPPGSGPSSLPLARPNNPVKWPIFADNEPIASGLQPEQNATLKLYNWSDYIYKKVLNDFSDKYKCTIKLSTFDNMDEAITKIRSGQVDFDVFFPTVDVLGKLIEFKFLRPLNHSYISNINQVWTELQNPFYDQGWQYTVPYVVYTTGVAWRVDHVSDNVAGMSTPYDIFWNTNYKGKVEILDDYREGISMTLLKNGILDVNTGSSKDLDLAKQELLALNAATNPLVNIRDYVDLPEGRSWVNQAWSGDMVNAQYYMPKGQSASVIRYWSDPVHAPVNNDTIAILASGKNPVLAHYFLNYMLDFQNAMNNFSWVGYQPPQAKVTADLLIKEQLVPKTLRTAVVPESIWKSGVRELELSPTIDSAWHDVWSQFKAG